MAITEIKLSGKVYTDAGSAVNGATVALLETGTSTEEASTTTNSSGEWSFTETSLDATYDIKITVGSSIRYILWSDEITVTGLDAASVKIRGVEGAVAPLYFFADQADDAGDGWRIQASASDTLAIGSDKASAGTIIDYLTITNGANAAASVVALGGDLTVGDDLSLTSDSAVFNMGAGNDFTITHDGTTGATIAGTPIAVNSTGALTLDSSTDITLDAGGADIFLKDDGTLFGTLNNNSGELLIKSSSSGTTAATFSGANVTFAGTVDATTDFTVGSTVITDDSIVMTPSTSDTVTIAGATHGILNVTTVDAAGTAADVNIDAGGEIVIDAADAAGAIFKIAGTAQLSVIDGAILPTTDNDIDLGSGSYQFKDAYINGTLEADAITIGGTNVVTGSLITTLGTISAGVWQGTAIASGYIAADAITGAKIADDAIDSEHYTDGSIDNAHIADDAIDSEHYADGSIDNAHIADDAIDSEHYADGSIDNAHIADDAIDSEHYADASIDFAHIQNVAANSILGRNANSSGVLSEVALATTQLLIGDGTGFTAAALSGDATMTNAGVVSLAAAQTNVTSLLATDIKIGEDAQTVIDFETANEIHFDADNAERVKIDSTGLNVVSGSLETATIDYTDGDLAITIADGGGITAAAGITSTAAANAFGASSFSGTIDANGAIDVAGATVTGSLLPTADDTYDLGSASAAWQDLFLEGDITLTDAGTIATSGGTLTLNPATTIEFNGNTVNGSGNFYTNTATGAAIFDEGASATNPTLIPNRAEGDTGIGWASDTIHIVLGGAQEYDFSTASLDLKNNTLLNVGQSGNDWTATNLFHTGDAGSGMQTIRVANTTTAEALGSARVQIETGSGGGDTLVRFLTDGDKEWAIGCDKSDSHTFKLSRHNLLGGNDAIKVTTANAITFDDSSAYDTATHTDGDFDYVCDGCGKHRLEMFTCCGEVSWHDDVLALRESRLNPEGIQHMAKLGILEIGGDDCDPGWIGINYQKAQHMTWAGMYQNRQRMDAQYDRLDERLARIEAAIGA
jgi:hypothetical protein